MTILDIATHLLSHFAPEERSIPDSVTYPGRNAAVLGVVNGTLEEMYGLASPWVAYDERGVILQAPETVDLVVTDGSNEATISALQWKAWMAGCTIVIEGAEFDNQIRNNERNVVLRFPHDGTSGTVTATIYHDSVTLGSDVMAVHEPVMIDGVQIPAAASTNSIIQTSSDRDFGFHRHSASALVRRVANSASSPRAYCIESWRPTGNTAPEARMRLAPAPAEKTTLQYSCKLVPPVIESISDSDVLPVPNQFVSSIFLPIAEKRISASPFYRGVRSPESIAENYKMALNLLGMANPRKHRGIRLISRH